MKTSLDLKILLMKEFFKEVREFGKFTKCPHKNARFPIMKKLKKFEERMKKS
jgi:hypothetical protein